MSESTGQVSRAARFFGVEALFLYSSRRFRQVSRLLFYARCAVALAQRHLCYVFSTTAASRESKLQPGSLVVTCFYSARRRRQRFVRNEAVVAQLCKLCLSPLVTALSARARVVQALEELALPSVLPLGEIGTEGLIRRGTTCFAVQTTPLRLRSPDFPAEDA